MSLPYERAAPSDAAVITDPAEFTSLKPEWQALWRRSARATPFQSPDWLIAWWDIFAPGELFILTLRQEGRLVALAPLYREGRRLLPIGISLSDYQDILIDPEFLDIALEGLGDALADLRDVDTLVFDEVKPDALALGLSISSWREHLGSASPCPILPLPDRVESLKLTVPVMRLRHLHTARRRVARRGDSAILEGDVDNAGALLADLARLNALHWDSKQSVFSDPRVAAFHAAAMPAMMQAGVVRLYALTINDAVAGVYYGFCHNGIAYAYLGGYDPEYAFESPGAVLIGYAMEAAIRDGCGQFDFLRGNEAYKYEWGAADRFNLRFTLSRNG
ncbi:CelD/BcsL family acetyltransferase involved in cellulose biosynthesis [Rhizomicrobium palustre]|uniref:CelD/BcsL family acetyltransferase involved in cellulose biosynthesis n=1 Tax=Rhizomicrobium palustre TaxID=189966 RepID=A0A846MUF3_9PROT|nr:GNAT family N-acetyltransferase [Rhizomicrobium palustre]NIK86742.1 CelD/BcsL family acetyltransferase involved in cellulose biosynthesis [Rhizomicrobium palustre]